MTPVTRCIGHAWANTDHFKWWCLRRMGMYGVCHVSEQRDHVAFLLSLLSCFIDSLFWHGLASLNLVISHDAKSFLKSSHCSLSFNWYIIMCLVSNERRENALDNEAYSIVSISVISPWYIGMHCITRFRYNKQISLVLMSSNVPPTPNHINHSSNYHDAMTIVKKNEAFFLYL